MKLTLKNYKLKKIKLQIKKNKLLIFCNFFNAKTKFFLKLKQKMLRKKLKFFNINSSLICYLLKNSIYLNLKNLNFGPVALLYIHKLKFFFELISNVTATNKTKLYFFCCIFTTKICDHDSFSASNVVFPPLLTALNITYSYPMPMGVRDPPRLSLQCRYVIQTVPPSPRPLGLRTQGPRLILRAAPPQSLRPRSWR